MSKDVNFRISLNIDGRQVLVQCKTDAQELAAQLGQVKSQSDIARQAIMKWSSLSTALQNAYQGAQQVAGVMNTYIQKANAAKESQVKLTTVMRQRMDAEKSDIDTINSLIAKQTELGVVGGTVQRSGLQQLATFASQRSTLETLLPAMNNLLVQQNGLNVSSESAVGVANLSFNSINVRLRRARRTHKRFFYRFQFHKGAIKTDVNGKQTRQRPRFNSIKVRLRPY